MFTLIGEKLLMEGCSKTSYFNIWYRNFCGFIVELKSFDFLISFSKVVVLIFSALMLPITLMEGCWLGSLWACWCWLSYCWWQKDEDEVKIICQRLTILIILFAKVVIDFFILISGESYVISSGSSQNTWRRRGRFWYFDIGIGVYHDKSGSVILQNDEDDFGSQNIW